jgi:hypothetical protein
MHASIHRTAPAAYQAARTSQDLSLITIDTVARLMRLVQTNRQQDDDLLTVWSQRDQ